MYIKAVEITLGAAKQPRTDAILVGSAGTLDCRFRGDGADITLTGLQAGKIYPFQLEYMYATGSAADIVGLTAGLMAN